MIPLNPPPPESGDSPRTFCAECRAQSADGDGDSPRTFCAECRAQSADGDGDSPRTFCAECRAQSADGDGDSPRKNQVLCHFVTVILFVTLGLIVSFIAKQPMSNLAQAVTGNDILSVIFGDAKTDISRAMLQTADSYMHGGIDFSHSGHDHGDGDSPHSFSAERRAQSADGDGDSPHSFSAERRAQSADGDGDGDSPHLHGEKDRDCPHLFDPWSWVNTRVRAPEIEKHLENEKTIEMMPWFWAAVKSDPHNIEAWTAAWYVSSKMMKDEKLALRIAIEGASLNPDSVEMLMTLGRAYRSEKTHDDLQSNASFLQALGIASRHCKNKWNDLPEKDREPTMSAINYIALSAIERNDAMVVLKMMNIAVKINDKHPTVSIMRKFLEKTKGL